MCDGESLWRGNPFASQHVDISSCSARDRRSFRYVSGQESGQCLSGGPEFRKTVRCGGSHYRHGQESRCYSGIHKLCSFVGDDVDARIIGLVRDRPASHVSSCIRSFIEQLRRSRHREAVDLGCHRGGTCFDRRSSHELNVTRGHLEDLRPAVPLMKEDSPKGADRLEHILDDAAKPTACNEDAEAPNR